jgi:hypothetical protein
VIYTISISQGTYNIKSFRTNHGNKVNVEILLAHFLLNIHKSGLRRRLGIDLEALEDCQPPTVVFQ